MFQEEEEQVRAEMEELRKIQQEFQELLKHPGWVRLASYAEEQVRGRTFSFSAPAKGIDGAFEQEYMKGEASGIALFMNFPEIITKDFAEQLEVLTEAMRDGN